METWTDKHKKALRPKMEAAVRHFNETYMGRIVSLREGVDPHNKNIPGRLTQRAVAEITGLLPQNYNKIEKGKIGDGNNLTLEQAIKLKVLYGCSIDYIALGDDSIEPSKIGVEGDELVISALKESLGTCRRRSEEMERQVTFLSKEYEKIKIENDRLKAEVHMAVNKKSPKRKKSRN